MNQDEKPPLSSEQPLENHPASPPKRANVLLRAVRVLRRSPSAFLTTIYRLSYRYSTDLVGDLRLGIATGLWKRKEGNAALQIEAYEPIPYATLKDIGQHIQKNRITTRHFLDIGCGLGRPLYYFANTFESLTGYEIVPDLYRATSAFLANAQKSNESYKNISLVLGDATAELPIDRDLVIFLYNPFGAEPMQRLAERLKLSPHRIDIYYAEPKHIALLEQQLGIGSEEFSSFVKVRYLHRPAH